MIRLGIVIFLFFFGITSFVFAVDDIFTISQTIGSDTTPPTIPNPVTVNPVTATQIDVSWGVSTDDQSLTGYRLFRDAIQIATTSLNTYADTGLTPSTTYTYTVEAYDWLLNISTTSTAVSTTTLSLPVSTTSTSSVTTGSFLKLRLLNLSIDTSETGAEISWQTNVYAQYSLRWGEESVYELGFVTNDIFKRSHQTIITGLKPGTSYMYELKAYDQRGREYILSNDSFKTKDPADIIPPLNVSNLVAVAEGNSVRLSWVNPEDLDFSKIRIVRNYFFYPQDTSNGYIAYEGTSNSYYDYGALRYKKVQYYTIFSYDESGNISSGAVIKVVKDAEKEVDSRVGNDTDAVSTSTTIVLQDMGIDFSDVHIFQNNIRIEPVDYRVSIVKDLPVMLQIPYGLFSGKSKTILVTVKDDTEQSFSYMFRLNKDKTVYEAILPSFYSSGEYILYFSVYNYKAEQFLSFEGNLLVEEIDIDIQQEKNVFNLNILITMVVTSFILFFLVLILYILYIRKKSD